MRQSGRDIKENGRVFRMKKYYPSVANKWLKYEAISREGDIFLECNDGYFKNIDPNKGRTDIFNIDSCMDYWEDITEEYRSMETGLSDSEGRSIRFDSLLKIPITINKELHGDHSIYRVLKKGSVAVLSYVKSEKGQIVPEGYMACLLTDKYRGEDLCLVNDISKLKPVEKIFVV